jgi:diguanylate cyclase (GGDEF)-like protein
MRIVVVDPSRLVLKSLSTLLAGRGHDVLAFVDGREALEHIKGHPDVDVLITSTEPVSLSGVELCWEARLLASGGRPIHIILMSSNCDQAHLIQALDCGADDFIGKPPAAQELFARLRCAERLLSMQRELMRLAATDPLTGILNRRAFFGRAQEIWTRLDDDSALSAIMFDIDHFKRVNDQYGHDAGDEAIRGVAREAAGAHPVAGRLGGEEFAILLEGSDLSAALAAAERLRAGMGALRFETGKGTMAVTCSFGVSQWMSGDSIDELLKRADVALYEAKHGGRNRVVGDHLVPSLNDRINAASVVRAVGRA